MSVLKICYVVLVLFCVVSASAKEDAFAEKVSFLYNQYIQSCATNVNVLLDEFNGSQTNSMPMIAVLPGYTNYCGVKVFIPSDCPKGFYDKLIATNTNKVDVYRIYIKEDSNADRVFLNSKGIEIARYKHPENYTDSSWYLKNYLTEVYKSCSTKEDYHNALSMYNPTKYCRSVDLIESTNLVTYLALEIQNTPPALPVVYKSSVTFTNIQLVISASVNTNSPHEKIIVVNYPPDDLATNSFTLYTTTNLLASWSRLCITNLNLSTNVFYYTDTETNSIIKYYKLYLNIDSDSDGLFDGDEKLIYGTSYLDSDSDDDFIPDKWEIENDLDPLSSLDGYQDDDGDMLPNSYEYFHDLNPHTNDSWQVTKLRVDPDNYNGTNVFETIQDAFDASEDYSIIEVAEGIHIMDSGIGAYFPSHPVMLMSDNWGTNRLTIIDYTGNMAAFALSNGQDNRTMIKGLTIRLKRMVLDSGVYQIAIYSGTPAFGSTPIIDGVGFVLGSNQYSYGIYCLGYSYYDLFVNNCFFVGAGDLNTEYFGICSFGGYNINIFNSTFMNFDSLLYSAGVHLQPINYMYGMSAEYTLFNDVFNSLWDESFNLTTNNAHAIAYVENTNRFCDIAVLDSVMPNVWTGLTFEVEQNLIITNLSMSNGYYLSTNSICIDNGGENSFSQYDFEGQKRMNIIDIGVDEFYGDNQLDRDNDTLRDVEEIIVYMSSPFEVDTDGDGLTDSEEANIYTTLLYRVDTDGDNVSDYDEVVNNTDPLNSSNYWFQLVGSVINETFYKKSPYYVSYSFQDNIWNTNNMLNISETNGYNYLVKVENSSLVYFQTLYDFNTNGVVDDLEPFSNVEITITDGVCELDCSLTMSDFDKGDGDGMADLWEEINGLCWTNALDVYGDPDHDGIENYWEFVLKHDPNVSNSQDYAIIDARNSIISRLENKNPTNALCLFVDPYVNPTPTNYIRNTNCWVADLDLTALSPWNSNAKYRRAGTLISLRHLSFSGHYVPTNGTTMHFVDKENNLYERTLVNLIKHPDYGNDLNFVVDIAVGILNEALPANKFEYVYVLPDCYYEHFGNGYRLPIIKLDKEEKALYGEIKNIIKESLVITTSDFMVPKRYLDFYEPLIMNDCSNPILLTINDRNVILATISGAGPGMGTSITWYKSDINEMMEELSNSVGVTNGYQLKEFDLSVYDVLPVDRSR